MKLLFLTSRLPFPPIGGDRLRTFNFIRHLNHSTDLTIISFIENEEELAGLSSFRDHFGKLVTVKQPKRKSHQNCVKGIFSRAPLQVHYYSSKEMGRVVERELQRGYDMVFCHLIRMAQYLPKPGKIRTVVDFTDAISLNYSRSKEHRKGLFSFVDKIEERRVLEYEHRILRQADMSIFISEVDSNYLRKPGTQQKIQIIPNGVNLEEFPFQPCSYDRNKIVFLGNMRTFPNSDAVIHFARDIFPLLKIRNPELKFYIVGNDPSKRVRRLHDGTNVIVTGFVDSVLPFLHKAAVLVAPMRAGAGVQNKILEAMAAGTPVVTSTIGAEGLDPACLAIAQTPEEFCLHVLTLVGNRGIKIERARRGRRYVEQNFSWSRQFARIDRYLGLAGASLGLETASRNREQVELNVGLLPS